MKKKKSNPERQIHIKATSDCYKATVIVAEKNAVEMLEDIRANFLKMTKRERFKNDKLIVKTCVHNPTLF